MTDKKNNRKVGVFNQGWDARDDIATPSGKFDFGKFSVFTDFEPKDIVLTTVKII